MMRDLDFERTKVAVRNLVANAKRLPAVAELREALLEVSIGGKRSGAEAWRDVLKAVSSYGVHREPTFNDPLVAEAVAPVGRRAICNAPETANSGATREKFADAYNSLASSSRRQLVMAAGVTQQQPRASLRGEARSIEELLHEIPRGRES